jgi:hypothetical protein
MVICHHCDNPRCVRLAHLFLGTPADNVHDMHRKGRGATGDRNGARRSPETRVRGDNHWTRKSPERLARGTRNGSYLFPESRPRGEAIRNAKLTDDLVRAMRAASAAGETDTFVALRFGVSRATVARVRRGELWRHVD